MSTTRHFTFGSGLCATTLAFKVVSRTIGCPWNCPRTIP